MRVVEKINSAIHKLMEENDDLYIIGEDILDPYGGAFKVTKGISKIYPERVLTTPISEPSIVGFSSGMAMNGKKVIVEIMFGDFLALTFDQIVNQISKFIWIYNDIKMPLIIRTPMGGGRGYGATHSQSLEKHFCGISGVKVLSINQFSNFYEIYAEALNSQKPTIIIENKVLYGKKVLDNSKIYMQDNPDIICVTYGGSLDVCIESAKEVNEIEEIITEVFPIEVMSPFNHKMIKKLSNKCKKFLFIEESGGGWGFNEMCKSALTGVDGIIYSSLTGPDHPIPSSKDWELNLMPNKTNISKEIINLFNS